MGPAYASEVRLIQCPPTAETNAASTPQTKEDTSLGRVVKEAKARNKVKVKARAVSGVTLEA